MKHGNPSRKQDRRPGDSQDEDDDLEGDEEAEILEKQQKRVRKLNSQEKKKETKNLSFQPLEGWIWYPGDSVLFPPKRRDEEHAASETVATPGFSNDESRMKVILAELSQFRCK